MRSNSLLIVAMPREIVSGSVITASMIVITGGGRELKRVNNSNEIYRAAPMIVVVKPRLDERLSPENDTIVPANQMATNTTTPKYTRTNASAPANANELSFCADIVFSSSEYQFCSFKDYVKRDKEVRHIQDQCHENAALLENLGLPDFIREEKRRDERNYVGAAEQKESKPDRPKSGLEDCYV